MTDGLVAAQTLRAKAICEGTGLHSGQPVTMALLPAPAGTGILFRRLDLLASAGPEDQETGLQRVSIAATPHAVTTTTLGTVIANRHGVSVSTIEHVMSALAGAGVDHAIVELNGPEVPIMDGSAAPFVRLIESFGVRPLPAARQVWRLTKPVRVEKDDAYIDAVPLASNEGLSPIMDVTVEYADPLIGRQRLTLEGEGFDYAGSIAAARTFCYLKDVETMRAQGLALGGSLENAIVVSDGEILNKDGLRYDSEFVRHKALDLLGDLFLLGAPLAARIVAFKPGHDLNTRFARAVLDLGAVERVTVPTGLPARARVKA